MERRDDEGLLCVRLRTTMHILIIAFAGVCVAGKGASEQESGRRGGEGAGFRASSAVHGLTNYLWNCCIHSHLNRNLSQRRRGPASPQHTAEQPARCRTTSSTSAAPTAVPSSSLLSFLLLFHSLSPCLGVSPNLPSSSLSPVL